jgi:segregation and condensation protein A
VEDDEDLELLEARDLLFARLLQYRAYKQAAAFLREREAGAVRRHTRDVALEPRFADLLPEVLLGVTPEQFAALATRALTPQAPPSVSVSHLHAPPVSVAEQLLLGAQPPLDAGTASFRALTADCTTTMEVVARVPRAAGALPPAAGHLHPARPLGELHVRWTGPATAVATSPTTSRGGDVSGPA